MATKNKPLKIFIIAGEASGDKLGGSLIHSLKQLADKQGKPLEITGVGGDFMQAQGLDSIFPMSKISMMGFVEIIPHIFELKQLINNTVEAIEKHQPDILITIDSPGFCNRAVTKLRKNNKLQHAKFVHYVAPTVWAYKPERAEKLAKLFDMLLVILPFEPPYFENHGLETHFIGHSITEDKTATNENITTFKHKYNINNDDNVICVFAGSRAGEIKRMLPIFGEVAARLSAEIPNLTLVFPLPSSVVNLAKEISNDWQNKPLIITDELEKKSAIKLAKVALVKSGTISLEVACIGTPMITTYRVNPISAWLIRRMLIIPYVNLINIIHDKFIIDEFIQEDCNVNKLTKAVLELYNDKAKQSLQKQAMKEAMTQLKSPNESSASDNAARILLGKI